MDNVVRLAELQDSGELSPAAEESLALAYAERHAHELRYVAPWGRWIRYSGTRWNFDDTLHAHEARNCSCRGNRGLKNEIGNREARWRCPKRSLIAGLKRAETATVIAALGG